MARIFITGATGYIGGDILAEISQALPDHSITCLVRNSAKAVEVAKAFPKVALAYGNLDDVELLEEEAKLADIVLSCADADHESCANALIRGLNARDREGPGFLIHTSGSANLGYKDIDLGTFGEGSTKVFDDGEGIDEVTSLPDHAPHRNVDKIVIEADSPQLRTAIVCPPTIYGVGRGPSNQRGHQLYELARCTLERKKGFQVGAGKTRWNTVHVHDMSKCYLALVKAASAGGGNATWGKQGYYFTENGEQAWGDASAKVAKAAHDRGLIGTLDVSSISPQEANELTPRGAILWGANSRGKAVRARKILGWDPVGSSFDEEIGPAVESEAKRLGLIHGHAAKAAGLV